MVIWKNSVLRTIVTLCLTATLLIATTGVAAAQPSRPGRRGPMKQPDDELITYMNSSGIGRIAVRLRLPNIPRYSEGAPIVVHTSAFFTPGQGFGGVGTTRIGAIEVSYLWPGATDSHAGVSSEGVYDYGGPGSIAAFCSSVAALRMALAARQTVEK